MSDGEVQYRTLAGGDAALSVAEAVPEEVLQRAQDVSPVPLDSSQLRMLSGYASITERSYKVPAFLAPYDEIISKGAFRATLAESPEVVLRFEHAGMPMASTRGGTLLLTEDDTGLRFDALLDASNRAASDMLVEIERGTIQGASFMFRVKAESYEDDGTVRIDRVDLNRGDVGPASYGINPHAGSLTVKPAAEAPVSDEGARSEPSDFLDAELTGLEAGLLALRAPVSA